MQTKSGPVVPEYARPVTLEDAARLMAGGGWRVLAGGTDLYPGAGQRLAGSILDVSGLADLMRISQEGEVRIGAAVTWSAIAEADLPPGLQALQQAARVIGGRQVQNAGTIGGNLCNASPAADGVPPLLACGAEVELISAKGARRLALSDFLLGPRRTALQPGEVLAAVAIPKPGQRGRSCFVKLGARSHLVISIAMVAARLVVTEGRLAEVALAVGSCSPVARRLPLVEAALLGKAVAEAVPAIRSMDIAAALAPIDDVRATADYRRWAAVELVRRAVAACLVDAEVRG